MSKTTNEFEESSVSCGFFNSLNDRKYSAEDFCKLFDGLITDGIFESVGSCFAVSINDADENKNTVHVGTGKCWFNNTWTDNIADLPVDCGPAGVSSVLSRYDAIVIRIDKNDNVRDNFIQVVHGEETPEPVKPTMLNTEMEIWHPLCYIYRKGGSTEIKTTDIEDVRGTESPYVTGIPQTRLPAETLALWRAELDQFLVDKRAEIEQFKADEETAFDEFQNGQETEYQQWFAEMRRLMSEAMSEFDDWSEAQKKTVLDWFEGMKGQLTTDAATNLQLQINKDEVKQILLHGFSSGTKEFSTDGTTITSKEPGDTGRTLVKTFTNGFATSTSVLTDHHGSELGRLVKTFSEDGNITSEITII